jgi:putative two-component system response regulator
MNPADLEDLQRAATLQDVAGLVPGENDWLAGRRTVLSDRVLGASPALAGVAAIVRATPERWDGKGPEGMAGPGIPLAARVISACGVFDAMTADGQTRPSAACAQMRVDSGTRFDPTVIKALTDVVAGRPDAKGDSLTQMARDVASRLGQPIGGVGRR